MFQTAKLHIISLNGNEFNYDKKFDYAGKTNQPAAWNVATVLDVSLLSSTDIRFINNT